MMKQPSTLKIELQTFRSYVCPKGQSQTSTVVTFLLLFVENRLLTWSVETVDSTGPYNQLVDGLKYIKKTVTKHPRMKTVIRRGRRILLKVVDDIL